MSQELELLIRDLDRRLVRAESIIAQLQEAQNDAWMTIPDAAASPALKGRLTAKQIRDRISASMANAATAVFVANVHYQILPSEGERTSYVVNVPNIAKLLETTTAKLCR